MYLRELFNETDVLRQELCSHKVYDSFKSLHDVEHFMQYHVFAVWDFMSLVKVCKAILVVHIRLEHRQKHQCSSIYR
jgi:hypothetical protein